MNDTTAAPTVTISLKIENTYELYPAVTTTVTDTVVPAPPAAADEDALSNWSQCHLFDLTGVGHTDGDSWYDVEVTACSDPSLVGKTFAFGY